MIKLKAHNKVLGQFSEIDKFLLVPKKLWDEIGEGDATLRLNGEKVKTRVYDILCNCVGEEHHHRLIDLRELWEKMGIQDGDEITVER